MNQSSLWKYLGSSILDKFLFATRYAKLSGPVNAGIPLITACGPGLLDQLITAQALLGSKSKSS